MTKRLICAALIMGIAGGAHAANPMTVPEGGFLANAPVREFKAGGPVLMPNDDITLEREDLYLSLNEVRITYEFKNHADTERHVPVVFPLPDIAGEFNTTVGTPAAHEAEVFDFSTTFGGEPVAAELHQSVFALGVDRTEALTDLGIPLRPDSPAAWEAINALPDEEQARLVNLGLIADLGHVSGNEVEYEILWTLKSAAAWTVTFQPGETAKMEHRYTPKPGARNGVSFLRDRTGLAQADFAKRYCLDERMTEAVRDSMESPDNPWSSPYDEAWLTYDLTTARDTRRRAREFHMTVDKKRPENLVAFCGEDIGKTSPTTYEVAYDNVYRWKDIEVLFLITDWSDISG